MFELKWIEPQSRWVIRTLFKRNFDTFADKARRRINWSMLLWDIIILYIVLNLI